MARCAHAPNSVLTRQCHSGSRLEFGSWGMTRSRSGCAVTDNKHGSDQVASIPQLAVQRGNHKRLRDFEAHISNSGRDGTVSRTPPGCAPESPESPELISLDLQCGRIVRLTGIDSGLSGIRFTFDATRCCVVFCCAGKLRLTFRILRILAIRVFLVSFARDTAPRGCVKRLRLRSLRTVALVRHPWRASGARGRCGNTVRASRYR